MSFEQFPAPSPQEQTPPTMRVNAPPPYHAEKEHSQEPRIAQAELQPQSPNETVDLGMLDTLRPPKEWAWPHEVSPSLKEAWDTTLPPEEESHAQESEDSTIKTDIEQDRHEGPTLRSAA